MAETAVQFVLDKFLHFVSENVHLIKDVREDVDFVKEELERITAFLRNADAVEDSNPRIKMWVKQVRDVSYAIEDIIDAFPVYIPDRNSCSPAFIQKFSFRMKSISTRREVAIRIQAIRTRIISIAEGNQRYIDNTNVPNQGGEYRGGDAVLVKEDGLVGIEYPKYRVVSWLVEGGSELKAVAVVGMGGLGKTTLARIVFDHDTVKKHFQNRAWITVSQSFKVEEFLKATIRQLFNQMKLTVPQQVSTMNNIELKMFINDFLRNKRYLLVFDDVWSIEDW